MAAGARSPPRFAAFAREIARAEHPRVAELCRLDGYGSGGAGGAEGAGGADRVDGGNVVSGVGVVVGVGVSVVLVGVAVMTAVGL